MVPKVTLLVIWLCILWTIKPWSMVQIENKDSLLTRFTSLESLQALNIQEIFRIILAALENADIRVNDSCLTILREIANGFENKTTIILSAAYNSGKDINDLGRYKNWKDANDTRYVALSVSGFPVNLYLGIWGPIECTEDDYNASSEFLATFVNQIISKYLVIFSF